MATSTATAESAPIIDRLPAPLWILWAGLLFGGMAMAGFENFSSGEFLKATRLTSSLVLVVAGFVLWMRGAQPPLVFPLLMIAMGMLFGFLGDVSNSRLIFSDPMQATLGGIVTFAIGHLFYMSACLSWKKSFGLHRPAPWWGSILFWQLIGIGGWGAVVATIEPRTAVHWAALPYSMLLAGTAGMSGGLALQDRRFILLGLGGAAFLASDLVLAFQLFRQDIDIANVLSANLGMTDEFGKHFCGEVSKNACWLLYGPAQMLIVYASTLLPRRLP